MYFDSEKVGKRDNALDDHITKSRYLTVRTCGDGAGLSNPHATQVSKGSHSVSALQKVSFQVPNTVLPCTEEPDLDTPWMMAKEDTIKLAMGELQTIQKVTEQGLEKLCQTLSTSINLRERNRNDEICMEVERQKGRQSQINMWLCGWQEIWRKKNGETPPTVGQTRMEDMGQIYDAKKELVGMGADVHAKICGLLATAESERKSDRNRRIKGDNGLESLDMAMWQTELDALETLCQKHCLELVEKIAVVWDKNKPIDENHKSHKNMFLENGSLQESRGCGITRSGYHRRHRLSPISNISQAGKKLLLEVAGEVKQDVEVIAADKVEDNKSRVEKKQMRAEKVIGTEVEILSIDKEEPKIDNTSNWERFIRCCLK